MSPWTNRLQRRTRSLASFSGLKAIVAPGRRPGARTARRRCRGSRRVATPAELSRKRRRLKEVLSVIVMSPWGRLSSGKGRSGGEPVAAAGVEQVGATRVGNEMDGAAGREIVALAEYRRHVGRCRAGRRRRCRRRSARARRRCDGMPPLAASCRCSGRVPRTTLCPSLPPALSGACRRVPSASSSSAPLPLRRSVPGRKFIAGEPMKPATKMLTG